MRILQDRLPSEMQSPKKLPGVAPCAADDWLRVDDAYAAQMAYRRRLLTECTPAVLWSDPSAQEAAEEVLDAALGLLPALGFDVGAETVRCPDGTKVVLERQAPLRTLGQLVQEDICILQKHGPEHCLTGAVLCFPANWRLADKAMRPLTGIHAPVHEYDDNIARRVQRMFDGVRAGKPLWRFNRLRYADPDLHQPRRREGGGRLPYIRSERQCVLRLPRTDAVIFTIHTFVVKHAQSEAAAAGS
jgi:hypothetical protein